MANAVAGRAVLLVTDGPIELDGHRGMMAQKATDLRRQLADVEANELALRLKRDHLEFQLVAGPAASWPEAAEKARYLLDLFSLTLSPDDSRKRKLIDMVLADFDRLSRETTETTSPRRRAAGPAHTLEKPMAKGHLRGNREKKKPKKDRSKDKAEAAASPFEAARSSKLPTRGKGPRT
jgi:hypothetical protein